MRLPRRAFLLVAAMPFLVLGGCQPGPESLPPMVSPTAAVGLRIGVSSGAAAAADLIARAYAKDSNHVGLQFVDGNNQALFDDLASGLLDAILVHHIPPDKEPWFSPIAVDGLVLVVHPENPVDGLGSGQAQAIFGGRIQNWREVGGPDVAIEVVGRERGSGARAILNQRIMGEQRLDINARIATGDAALRQVVSTTPGAIGYSMLGADQGLKLLTLDGVSPARETVADQSYPLSSPLYFVSEAEPGGDLRALLAWLQSPDGQRVLGEKYGRVR
jgi:DNA-binding transcriptional LysR family regulator